MVWGGEGSRLSLEMCSRGSGVVRVTKRKPGIFESRGNGQEREGGLEGGGGRLPDRLGGKKAALESNEESTGRTAQRSKTPSMMGSARGKEGKERGGRRKKEGIWWSSRSGPLLRKRGENRHHPLEGKKHKQDQGMAAVIPKEESCSWFGVHAGKKTTRIRKTLQRKEIMRKGLRGGSLKKDKSFFVTLGGKEMEEIEEKNNKREIDLLH